MDELISDHTSSLCAKSMQTDRKNFDTFQLGEPVRSGAAGWEAGVKKCSKTPSLPPMESMFPNEPKHFTVDYLCLSTNSQGCVSVSFVC